MLFEQKYIKNEGFVFGICGGMQMMGISLEDTSLIESSEEDKKIEKSEGLGLLPIKTIFKKEKTLSQRI